MQVQLTIHAIERFQERISPHSSFKRAKKKLMEATQRATPLRERTHQGHILWLVAEPSMRLVMKANKRSYICVTVLPPEELVEEDFSDLSEAYEVRVERQHEELIQLEDFLKTAKKQEQINLAQKREVLALEHEILSLELAALKHREQTKRHQLGIQLDQDIHKRALRFAMRALYGEISRAEALAHIASLDEALVHSSFYKRKNEASKKAA